MLYRLLNRFHSLDALDRFGFGPGFCLVGTLPVGRLSSRFCWASWISLSSRSPSSHSQQSPASGVADELFGVGYPKLADPGCRPDDTAQGIGDRTSQDIGYPRQSLQQGGDLQTPSSETT